MAAENLSTHNPGLKVPCWMALPTCVLILLHLVSPVSICQAQIKQGTWLIGGNFTGGIASRERFSRFNMGVNPIMGRFVNNNLCLGLSFPLEYDDKNYKNFPMLVVLFGAPNNISGLRNSRDLDFSVSPFFRKYFGKTNFLPFLQAGILYKRNVNKSQYTVTGTVPDREFVINKDIIGFGFGAGINYFINNKLAFESVLEYSRQYELLNIDIFINKTSDVRLRVGLVLFLSRQ